MISQNKTFSTKLYFLLLVALISVSSTSLVIRYVESVPALTMAFWRMLLASGFLWVYSLSKKRTFLSKTNKKRILIAGISLGLHFSFFFLGVRNTSIANATLLATTGPFFTTLIAYLKGTKFEKEVYWGLGISTIGLLIVQGQSINLETRFLYGNFLSLLSGMCIAVTYIFAAKIRKNTENTTYGRTLFFIASITIALLAFLVGDSLINFKKEQFIWLLFLGFVPSILGHNLLNYSIKFLSPTAVASVPLGEPLIASVFGYVLFSEALPLEAIVGGGLILFGIYFIITGHNKD